MDSYPGDFPFGIMDVVELLHLRIRRRQANSVYVDCPFCGDRRGKMNVNFVKNVWRCNYCDEHGGRDIPKTVQLFQYPAYGSA